MPERQVCRCALCGVPHPADHHWCACCNGGPCEHRAMLYRLEPLSEAQRRQVVALDARRFPR